MKKIKFGYSPYRYNDRPAISQERQPITTLDLCDEQDQNVYTDYGREMHTEDLGYDPSRYDGDDNLPLDVLEQFERRGKVKW